MVYFVSEAMDSHGRLLMFFFVDVRVRPGSSHVANVFWHFCNMLLLYKRHEGKATLSCSTVMFLLEEGLLALVGGGGVSPLFVSFSFFVFICFVFVFCLSPFCFSRFSPSSGFDIVT